MTDQRTALVTGANRGIGLEVARQLSHRGFHVFLGVRHPEAGVKACAELGKGKAKLDWVEMDMTKDESIRAAVKKVSSSTDHLDVLVNNAGICEDASSSILDLEVAVVWRTLATNTVGPLLALQHFLPLLRKSQAGRVINVSSGLGALHQMGSGYPSYRLSKAALNAFTRIAAAELGTAKIAVNSVSPGWVRTDMGGPDATSSLEEGADTIVWLATEAPQSLTGQFVEDRKTIAW